MKRAIDVPAAVFVIIRPRGRNPALVRRLGRDQNAAGPDHQQRKGLLAGGGIIELYVESGRMRFAINVDATLRSGLRLSSRLLGLANVVRDSRGLQ